MSILVVNALAVNVLAVRYEELARKNKVSPAPENLRSIQERCEADYKLHKFRKPLWTESVFGGPDDYKMSRRALALAVIF